MSVSIKISDERLRELFGRLPSSLEREMAAAQIEMGERQIASVKDKMRMADGLVRTRTGLLARGMARDQRRTGSLGQLRTRVFVAGVKYAETQEYGATIRPKRKRYLTIPMDSIKTAAGAIVGKYASGAGAYGKSSKGTFVLRLAHGLFIAEREGKGRNSRLKLLWRLVKQVVVPGNLGWFSTWRKSDVKRRDVLRRAAQRALEANP